MCCFMTFCMANIITGIRILCSIALIFCSTYSSCFYTFYLTSGFTDMVDGAVARKTNTVSEFGSNFDTFADFIFVLVCLVKFIPFVNFPIWSYIWILLDVNFTSNF